LKTIISFLSQITLYTGHLNNAFAAPTVLATEAAKRWASGLNLFTVKFQLTLRALVAQKMKKQEPGAMNIWTYQVMNDLGMDIK
jgi:hypothetical protein